jgi:biopolymer transport protein ExbD
MRRKRNLNLSDDEPILDISSLIDVCFLLLIYFLVTSTIQPREQDLPMTIPKGYGVPGDEVVKVLIGLKGDGSIVMNAGEDEEVMDTDSAIHEIPQTKERLKMMNDLARSNDSELFVQILSEEGVTHQRFIDLLNCLKGEGISKIMIANYDKKPL